MDWFVSVALFAFATSATPGPNNVIAMSSGLNFGIQKTLPLLTGICIGFALMLWLVGLGLGQVFVMYPLLQLQLKVIGSLYLLYLSWSIVSSTSEVTANEQSQPLSFFHGAVFQWVNAKAWVVAVGALSAFTAEGVHYGEQALLMALIFLIVAFPSVGVWVGFGALMKKWLNEPRKRRWFNYAMGGALALSTFPIVMDVFASLK